MTTLYESTPQEAIEKETTLDETPAEEATADKNIANETTGDADSVDSVPITSETTVLIKSLPNRVTKLGHLWWNADEDSISRNLLSI